MGRRVSHKRFANQPTIPFDDLEYDSVQERIEESTGHFRTQNEPGSELADSTSSETAQEAANRLLYYVSMGSGSSGNCCYVGTRKGGILIDAGVRPEKVEEFLKSHHIGMNQVKAILLTHDHTDHVKYAYSIARTYKHIRIFCTNRVIGGILRRTSISKRIREYHHAIFKEIPFKIADFEITAFEVSHDSSDSMGFSIEFDGRHFVLATDMGEVQPRARHYISQANYLVIEANYDLEMLRFGRYPAYLKARIQTAIGHMDNVATGAILAEVAHPGLKYIFLCHLSQDNNTPEKALTAVRAALEGVGLQVGTGQETLQDREADVQLSVLPRYDATRLYVFRPE